MSKRQVVKVRFAEGEQSTSTEDATPYPLFREVHDFRVDQNGIRRRPGMVRVARAGNAMECVVLNGSSQYIDVPLDTRVFAAMGKRFTVEWLCAPDVKTGTRPLFDGGVTTPAIVIDTDGSSKLRVRVWDEDGTLSTLTSTNDMPTTTYYGQLVRDGADLTLRVDGAEEDTTTMDASKDLETPVGNVRFGYDGTNYFDGKIDYFRILKVARANHNDGMLRFPDPLCEYVLADYDFDLTAEKYAIDRSVFQNTGVGVGTPTTTTALAYQTVPVSLIKHYQTRSGEGRVLVCAGEQVYDGRLS